MATTYEERFQLAEDGRFRRRLQVALWVAASTILVEPANTPNHGSRMTFARANLRGPADADVMRRIAIRTMADPSIGDAGEAATDVAIQAVVNALVDELTS